MIARWSRHSREARGPDRSTKRADPFDFVSRLSILIRWWTLGMKKVFDTFLANDEVSWGGHVASLLIRDRAAGRLFRPSLRHRTDSHA